MPDFFFKDSAGFQQGLFFVFFLKGKDLITLCEKEKGKGKRINYSMRERKTF